MSPSLATSYTRVSDGEMGAFSPRRGSDSSLSQLYERLWSSALSFAVAAFKMSQSAGVC